MKDPIKEQAAIFRVLADPTRLKLLKLLCNQREPDALCVNAMVSLLGVSQPAISQHLRALKSVGMVKDERRGYYVHYSVDSENLLRFKSLVSDILTPGKREQDDPCKNCPSGNKSK
jgi:ArsR family transcriptional regulator